MTAFVVSGWSAIRKFGLKVATGAEPAKGKRLGEIGFKIGFNTRRRGRNCQRARADAEHRIKNIGRDPEFRNQQVSGSSPDGGSIKSSACKPRTAEFNSPAFPEPLGFFFNN